MAKSSKASDNGALTPKRFAELVGVTVKTVHVWRKLGLIEADRQPNGRYLIPRSEAERLGARQRTTR